MTVKTTYKLAAIAALLVSATPAAAAISATASAEARGLVLQPLTLTKVSDLDFGTIIASAVAGTVSIDADSGARSSTGGITEVPTAPGGRAEFAGAGTTGQLVLLTLAAPTLLVSTSNASDTLSVTSLSLDSGGASRTIGATQAFSVGVGGNFAIAASQANGLYTAQFDLTASYQ